MPLLAPRTGVESAAPEVRVASVAGEMATTVATRRRTVTIEALAVVVMAIFGFRLGARPIRDNSMFTHLRTGFDMVRGGGIPRTDPYSFTARGHPWVVQSWLAEWTYGVLQQIGRLRPV